MADLAQWMTVANYILWPVVIVVGFDLWFDQFRERIYDNFNEQGAFTQFLFNRRKGEER